MANRKATIGRMTWAACLMVPAALLAIASGEEPDRERAAPAVAALDAASAAQAFIATLDEAAREKALYPLADEERFDWHFIPRERNGLPLAGMTVEQRAAAHDLLQSALSSQGYHKANAIIELERVLGMLEGRPERRDPENYYVTIFGEPSAGGAWAWRFEGHHLSFNFSSPSGTLTVTGPAFMGANPARVPSGPKAGWRPLGREEDLARALLLSLSAEQRTRAVISAEAPSDILTGNDRRARLDAFEGLPADAMTEAQRAILFDIVHEYVGNMTTDFDWMMRVQNEIPAGDIHFAWAGSSEPEEGHYYRIHSPVFLIEYDNTQNDANHVHSVWRDLENDFGGDALARHYEESDHH
ncbi:DUF3500 domain-containing protein [Candidatus Palauibacter sp.]|uniref:DUF3500 domain-containing protein n=1 Tax=Candidatus Palauibacter sp. TaxID=3101350 RepID=UPI003C6F3BB2